MPSQRRLTREVSRARVCAPCGDVPSVLPARHLPGVLEFEPPRSEPVPVVFDSPHSGAHYPRDFGHCMSQQGLRRLEDAFVDELFAHGPAFGAAFLRALFPRSYIDPNRAADDIDLRMLHDEWPHPANPGPKSECGIGLIFRFAAEGPLYRRKLSAAEVRRRLDRYYWPYHRTLEHVLEHTWRSFGCVLHLNCHSMRSVRSTRMSQWGRGSRPDFVLGDRDGTSCDPALTHWVRDFLQDAGYAVSVNAPYKGVELVRRYSNPALSRHSMQIEINRALYMDEQDVRKTCGFASLKRTLESLTAAVGEHMCA
jgi:N-formylglutamate amidohydrolase